MAKKNKTKKKSSGQVPLPTARKEKEVEKQEEHPTHPSQNATRETFESLAIAFILAFLIRTFVAEPFVIPTGSMSPALQGVHKDLECPQCGQRYRVNASTEDNAEISTVQQECVAGMCPMCRYTTPYDKQLAEDYPQAPKRAQYERSYSGDRIVVNKFLYSFQEPQRWDVVVFKYPGNSTDNYIKRLVGLPEETLQVFGGDLFVKHTGDDDFEIVRKPPTVAHAMREPVHDTHRDPANLHNAGWPLRWVVGEGWEVDTPTEGKMLRQKYTSSGEGEHWMQYVHTPPDEGVWPTIEQGGKYALSSKPQLISDFNPYNTRLMRFQIRNSSDQSNPFRIPSHLLGLHWVGDLHIETDLDVQSSSGQFLVELVEAGNRFRCTIDLASGKASLNILPYGQDQPADGFAPTADTVIDSKGKHRITFANVDDTLLLWVDDRLVEFDQPTSYDWDALLGNRQQYAIPRSSADEPGDLAPVRIGSIDAQVAIDRLQVFRDIYYIADSGKYRAPRDIVVRDYPGDPPPRDLLSNPSLWNLFQRRQSIEFPLDSDQFFVMGDNSPFSLDARLWNQQRESRGDVSSTKPGGNYLERRLMIGRAISVVWPHPWHYVIPSFTDMRRIQ